MASASTGSCVDSEISNEVSSLKAAYPSRCRVMCDVGQYKTVITLQPENIDATVKFQLTAAYPSVIPEIKVRSESLTDTAIQDLQEALRSKAQELMGKEMIQALMTEAQTQLKCMGLRPGKAKNAKAETFIDDQYVKKNKKSKNKQSKALSQAKQLEEEVAYKKLPPMKTAEDVVNRIKWDDNLDSELFLVGYIDRFRGLLEKYFSAFSWEDIATVDYDVLAVPKHRIQYFKYKEVKVWDKTKRIDNVYGSANGTKTIDVVIKEIEEQEERSGGSDLTVTASAVSRNSSNEEESESDSDDEDFITVTISNSVNIGTGEDKCDDHDTESSLNPYWADKLRPNYFLCIRITDQSIINGIGNIQDNILKREPILAECCIPGASLHLTVSMLGLDTVEQLQQCMDVLNSMKPDLKSMLPKSPLTIKGVSNFYGRVVYGKAIYKHDFMDFCDYLKLNLREAGVQIRDGYEFVPHVTILKTTRPVSRMRRSKNIDPNYYAAHLDSELGSQSVTSLYLCSVGNQRRSDGFYLTPLEMHFDKA